MQERHNVMQIKRKMGVKKYQTIAGCACAVSAKGQKHANFNWTGWLETKKASRCWLLGWGVCRFRP
jgi:hypothetical protein